jgi:prophage maintenance system killer protein
MRSFLIANGLDIKATQNEKYDFVINIASGNIRLEEIIEWRKIHTENLSH